MLVADIDSIKKEASLRLDPDQRSKLGQYMTPVAIARFMASLFQNLDQNKLKLLDAGSGIGTLTTVFIDTLIHRNHQYTVDVTCYEIDTLLLDYLRDHIQQLQNENKTGNLTLCFEIKEQDFINDSISGLLAARSDNFTHAILNPPYAKVHSQSNHRKLLRLIQFETVNLYPAFVALALLRLAHKGELVAIIPRSFCNGNYYKSFRELVTKQAAIKQIHLFGARNKAFKEDDVLQENIILYLVKGEEQGDVIISRSTNHSFNDLSSSVYAFKQIIKESDPELFIHIPNAEKNELAESSHITYSLKDIDVEVSTGPVVDFRAKDFTRMNPEPGAVPLPYPVHFNGKEIDYPKQTKKPNAIVVNQTTLKMLYPSGFYSVVKRFSAKEEKQRIVARVVNPVALQSEYVGLENHLNVFHYKKRGLDEDMAYGISAYLNSTYVDKHFRSFNGHTQVNATDLRQMKYPSKENLIQLGRWAKHIASFEPKLIDPEIEKMI